MTPAMEYSSRVETVMLIDGDMRASVLNYGAITQSWWFKDIPLILGFDDPIKYLLDTSYVGAVVGRVANRIGGARFELAGTRFGLSANEGKNTLHGGAEGLSKQFWNLRQTAPNEVVLHYLSHDGESGFPANVRFEVSVTLRYPRLTYILKGYPDRPTPISLTQHNYYSLGSSKGVDAHKLELASVRYLELDEQGVPSGAMCSTKNGELDFSAPRSIGHVPKAIDHYFCFDLNRDPTGPIAKFTAPSGLSLTAYSDQPGVQVYSGAQLAKPLSGSAGLCIEPSGYPNAPNIPSFPSIICTYEKPYRQVLTLEISEDGNES